jgi:hypothetical protein
MNKADLAATRDSVDEATRAATNFSIHDTPGSDMAGSGQQEGVKHTPLPWEISKHGTPECHPQFGLYAEGCHRDHVIVKGDNPKEDAEFICRAVNSFKSLLAALEECITDEGAVAYNRPDRYGRERLDAISDLARAAIAKATVKP